MNQNESNGGPKFITTIGLRGKLASYWKTNKRQSWKWKGVCRACRNPILESSVGQMGYENIGKTCKA